MLLSRKARWPSGKMQRVWVNRSRGEYRTEPVFAEREVTIEVEAIALRTAGALDRSAMVRERVADGLIALRLNCDIPNDLDQIATSLRDAPHIGVRNRIEFFSKPKD
jgi:hypothetical protein